MNKFIKLLLSGAVLLFAAATQIHAQTNLSVQGTVQNFDGSAVDNGSYEIGFKLYTTETGGTAVWTETQSVQLTGGVYSVLLGEVEPLTVAFDQTYYLGIKLPGGPELTPRSRLTSSPYALSLIGSSNIFPSAGTVGVGTAAPTAGNELHVKDAAADAKVLVEGETGSEIEFKKGANSASITYDGNNINIENLNLVFSAGLNLPAGQTVKYNGISDWRLIETDDFETNNDYEGWICHDRWDNSNVVQYQRIQLGGTVQNGYVLRAHINGDDALKKQLNLTGIPHNYVKVVFTYHFLDSWEGNSQGEYGYAGFSSVIAPVGGQYIIGWNHHQDEGIGTNYWTGAISGFSDYNTRQEMVIKNSDDNLWIIVANNLNQDSFNESYAIDDIEIWVK